MTPPRLPGEGERVADEHPEHRDDAHRDEALQHDGEEVLSSHQAAIEKGQAWCHHHDQSGADQDKSGVTVVDHLGLLRTIVCPHRSPVLVRHYVAHLAGDAQLTWSVTG